MCTHESTGWHEKKIYKRPPEREKTESLPHSRNRQIHVSRKAESQTAPYDGESKIILRVKLLEHDMVTLLFIVNSVWV